MAPGSGVLDLGEVFDRDLTGTGADGDDAGLVPAGVYAVSWAGYSGARGSPATVSVTFLG